MDTEDHTVLHVRAAPLDDELEIRLEPLMQPLTSPLEVQTSQVDVGRYAEIFADKGFEGLEKLSRQHARLFVYENTLYVEDLGSLNGTYVNNRKLGREPQALTHNDQLDFAGVLQFNVAISGKTHNASEPQQEGSTPALTLKTNDELLPPLVVDRFPFELGRANDEFAELAATSPQKIKQLSLPSCADNDRSRHNFRSGRGQRQRHIPQWPPHFIRTPCTPSMAMSCRLDRTP